LDKYTKWFVNGTFKTVNERVSIDAFQRDFTQPEQHRCFSFLAVHLVHSFAVQIKKTQKNIWRIHSMHCIPQNYHVRILDTLAYCVPLNQIINTRETLLDTQLSHQNIFNKISENALKYIYYIIHHLVWRTHHSIFRKFTGTKKWQHLE